MADLLAVIFGPIFGPEDFRLVQTDRTGMAGSTASVAQSAVTFGSASFGLSFQTAESARRVPPRIEHFLYLTSSDQRVLRLGHLNS
jgi:hypothetical protein